MPIDTALCIVLVTACFVVGVGRWLGSWERPQKGNVSYPKPSPTPPPDIVTGDGEGDYVYQLNDDRSIDTLPLKGEKW